jgi:2'-5' RNA ligase
MGIIYTGVFFDFSEAERERLLKRAGASDMPNKFLHHVTLQFKPSADSEHVAAVLKHEGSKVSVNIVGVSELCSNRRVAAFAVELGLDGLGINCANKVPHLTVATAEGVKPFEANNATFIPLEHPFKLEGRLGCGPWPRWDN